MPDNRAVAIVTVGRNRVDGTLKTVKHMVFVIDDQLKRSVVIIAAHFARSHWWWSPTQGRNLPRRLSDQASDLELVEGSAVRSALSAGLAQAEFLVHREVVPAALFPAALFPRERNDS
jgi:hypothetical protein